MAITVLAGEGMPCYASVLIGKTPQGHAMAVTCQKVAMHTCFIVYFTLKWDHHFQSDHHALLKKT